MPAVVREPVDEVADRAERPRRREVVAAGDHDRGEVGGLVGEAADERRLPDPGLAGHAHQPSRAAPRRAEGARQLRQRLVALEEGERVDVVERRWRAHLAPPVASPLVHRHDHPVAAAVGRRDHRLACPVVADGTAGGLDPARQRGLADEAVTPDRVEQLLLADHTVGMGGEVDQHVEDLGLDRHEQAGAAQLVAIEIELAVAEGEDHARPSKTVVSDPSVANRPVRPRHTGPTAGRSVRAPRVDRREPGPTDGRRRRRSPGCPGSASGRRDPACPSAGGSRGSRRSRRCRC